jgi:cytosolic carboxypeptidase protein 2/3
MKQGVEYQFQLTNLTKRAALYSHGMQPLIYSEYLARHRETGWHRAGYSIKYTKNPYNEKKRSTFTLSFTLTFPITNDVIYIAHCYPYTYTKLQRLLGSLIADQVKSEHFRHKVVGKTLQGNNFDLISITKKVSDPVELANRMVMIFTSRIHPGETNSSWMMHGLLEFLLGESDDAVYFRSHYIVKIIPMLNPDGVIVGNYRCNIKGYDLNRSGRSQSHSRMMLLKSGMWYK